MYQHHINAINFVKSITNQYAIGGSIGLMMRGIDLKRDLRLSDLDVQVIRSSWPVDVFTLEGIEESSNPSDFDHSLRYSIGGPYVKLEVKKMFAIASDMILYEGVEYNVLTTEEILYWKKKYADNGNLKHRDDLITIETGVRPDIRTSVEIDDLPF